MTEKEKSLKGYLYDANSDETLLMERSKCKDICFAYNQLMPSAEKEHQAIIHKLFQSAGNNITILSPFWCDYGYNITLGEDVFINHNCVILDCAKVSIGSHVFIGPNCGFHTPFHPLDVEQRIQGYEYANPITIEDNVWIGASVTILAGVTIGKNSVIGAGSVVNKSIPANVLAVGNPCRILREIPEKQG